MREKIIFNNSLESFSIEDPEYGYHQDLLFNDRSSEVEKKLNSLKSSAPTILSTLIEFFKTTDSKKFCSDVIGDSYEKKIDISDIKL